MWFATECKPSEMVKHYHSHTCVVLPDHNTFYRSTSPLVSICTTELHTTTGLQSTTGLPATTDFTSRHH